MDLRALILSQNDTPLESVEVPEWRDGDGKPVVVYLRPLTGAERDDLEASCLKGKGKQQKTDLTNFRARVVVRAAVKSATDPSPLFTPADVPALGGKNGKALDRLYETAARISGIRPEDEEEIAGN